MRAAPPPGRACVCSCSSPPEWCDAPDPRTIRLPTPTRKRVAAARLHVPVDAGLDDKALVAEPKHRATGQRLGLAVRCDEGRPPLDGCAVALLDGLAEGDVLQIGRAH